MSKIQKQTEIILGDFYKILNLPASISGKYHLGETFGDHLERCVTIIKHLCDEFKIPQKDREMLIACAYLHDLGNYIITIPKEVNHPKWMYFRDSKCSRNRQLHLLHPLLSAMLLEGYKLERKKEVQDIIITHMSHWYPHCPQPETFYQQLLAIADYLSTRKKLFNYEERGRKNETNKDNRNNKKTR